MALSEDVFDDTMPPCEKLYNAQEALQSRFRELVSSRYYQSLHDSRSSRLWPARSLEMTQQIIVSSVINMTDIDTYSSQGCTPNRAPVWFDLVPALSVPVPGSSLQASPSVTCSGLLF